MKKVLATSAVVCILGLTACNSIDPKVVESTQTETTKNDLSFTMSLSQAVSDSVEKPIISVYNGDSLVTEMTLTKQGNTIGGIIRKLPVGKTLTFVLVLYGKNGDALYEGSATSVLQSAKVTPITIKLKATAGSVEIIGIIEGDTTIITDTSKFIISGDSLVQETYVYEGKSFSNKNYGQNPWLPVGNHGTDGIHSSLIRFNLDSFTSSNQIDSAILVLKLARWWTEKGSVNTPDFQISVFNILESWKEGYGGDPLTAGWSDSSTDNATWTGSTNSFNINGATALESSYNNNWRKMCDSTPEATFPIQYRYGKQQTISVDVTSLVKKWISTPSSNHGIALIEAGNKWTSTPIPMFMSSENNRMNAQGPALEITLR